MVPSVTPIPRRTLIYAVISDEILEFLFDFQMWKPLFQATDLMLKKLGQII